VYKSQFRSRCEFRCRLIKKRRFLRAGDDSAAIFRNRVAERVDLGSAKLRMHAHIIASAAHGAADRLAVERHCPLAIADQNFMSVPLHSITASAPTIA